MTENNHKLVSFQKWPLTHVDITPEKAVYNIAYNTEKDETEIFLRADREVLSMKTELITCGGKQSLHVITSGEPHPGQGIFEQWGKGHFPSMEESEQLQIWRDKNLKQTMNAVCNTPHRTACRSKEVYLQDPWPQLVRVQTSPDEGI